MPAETSPAVQRSSHMSLNASLNASHLLLPSNSLSHFICTDSPSGTRIFTAFATTNALLLLPLSAMVLHVAFQRWRRQRSTPTSHADLFTYHMVAMEIFSLVGTGLYSGGTYVRNERMMMFGFFEFSFILPGQASFHCLTCVERYLAVVHPITYRSLRKTGGVRIRNISIGCVWLLCVGWMGVTHTHFPNLAVIPYFSLFTFSLLVSAFCSVSVLRALTRPSPGDRRGVDQSRQRVIHTVVAIMGLLLLRFSGLVVCLGVYVLVLRMSGDVCLVFSSAFWLCLPSSLVLPMLFLYRAGKLTKKTQPTAKTNTNATM